MDREGAETYLRLLAEAELRRATTNAAGSPPGRWHSARLALAAQALSAVGAVGADVADQIQADVRLAVAGRHRLAAPGPGPDRIRRVVPVLRAAGVLPPDSPAPGQLAGLCARLGIDGHGISAPPNRDLPERWHSLLDPPAGREPRAPQVPGMLAAAAAELPELDGAQITIMGVHRGERGSTIMHLLVSGVTLEDDWAYARGVVPLPVLWIRDSEGRWHATHTNGVSPCENIGVVVLSMMIVPPLDGGTTWIEIAAAGRSARVRARLPLSSQ